MKAEEFYVELKKHLGFGQLWMCIDDGICTFRWHAPKARAISWDVTEDVLYHCSYISQMAHRAATEMRGHYRFLRKVERMPA